MKRYNRSREKLILTLKGALMGAADIVPGVSGGTMALISGIYDHLIMAIGSVKISHVRDLIFFFLPSKRKQSKESLAAIHLNFLFPLGIGILAGVLIFSRIIPALLQNYPLQTYSFFFGLILFSLSIPYRKMHKHFLDFLLLIIFALATFAITGFVKEMQASTGFLYVFFSGSVAICAMILPGISGAYILLILGEYNVILNALHTGEYRILGIFILGLALGLFSFVRLLKFLLFHHHSRTMAALTGTMAGSMYKLWPFQYTAQPLNGTDFTVFAVMALAGMAFIFLMEKAALLVQDPEPPVSHL